MEHITNPMKEVFGQLLDNTTKSIGWLPLIVSCYIAFGELVTDEKIQKHLKLIVPLTAFFLYIIGDALDKLAFPMLKPKRLGTDAARAKKALCLEEGIYSTSKALAVAANKYGKSSIQFKNESAKFLRSLVLPSLVVGLWYFSRNHAWVGIVGILAVPVFLFSYVWLKASHMADLYRLSVELSKSEKYEAHDLTAKVRLFFWDGEQVSSGKRPS